MQSSKSVHSTTLEKQYGGRMDNKGRGRLSFANILGDPFALATISIAILAWLLTVVSAAVSAATSEESIPFPKYSWFSIAYMLCAIVGITLVVASDTAEIYCVAIVGYLAAAILLTTSSVQSLIYKEEPAKEAGAAGFLLLAMISIIWVFYFGSSPAAAHREYIDSFALHKDQRASMRTSRPPSNMPYGSQQDPNAAGRQPPQMYTSAQLNGFETSSPVTGYAGGPLGAGARNSSHSPMNASNGIGNTAGAVAPVDQQGQDANTIEYPYRAKAIYSYEANPDDANEISFTKHEILEVSDVSGRWWQAKKETGETGIAPSNYLILL